jgi:hypothetical protein
MKKTKQYRSPLMASIHETAEGLHAAGLMNFRLRLEDAAQSGCRAGSYRA